VLLIAFLIVGPKDLPKVARWLGRMVKRLRLLIKELKEETGWAEFEKELNDTRTDVETTLKDVRHDLDITPELKNASEQVESGIRDIRRELRQTNQELKHTDTH